MPQRIQRKRTRDWRAPSTSIYVGRPTIWGNPFRANSMAAELQCIPLGLDGRIEDDRRRAAIQMYRWCVERGKMNALIVAHLDDEQCKFQYPDVALIRRLLRGKDLLCWCPLDRPCHADVLLEIANA